MELYLCHRSSSRSCGRIEAAPEGVVKRSRLCLSPRRLCRFQAARKLGALIGFADRIAGHGGREAALRTYGETILLDPLRRVIDAIQQIFDTFEAGISSS